MPRPSKNAPNCSPSDRAAADALPAHVAVIMDGNGRWARARGLQRAAGHRRGLEIARALVGWAAARGIARVTLFAFSSENWRRPRFEVDGLLALMKTALTDRLDDLIDNGVRLRFLGARESFPAPLAAAMTRAEAATAECSRVACDIAAGYGGRWDIAQACRRLLADKIDPANIDEQAIESRLATAGAPPPDLLIRTSGEMRISNFFLWQSAYAELYFCDALWPDFGEDDFARALAAYAARRRRYGRADDEENEAPTAARKAG